MENQHKKIKGYRDLSQAEIDLMNRIKSAEQVVAELCTDVYSHISKQESDAENTEDDSELERIENSNPTCWWYSASHDFQVSFMKLVRAVAQPITPF